MTALPALLAELRRLADAVDALETASGYECGYGDSLRRIAEKADALESDARRYRWLRDPCSGAENVVHYCRGDYGKGLMSWTMLDETIDAAIEESKSHD